MALVLVLGAARTLASPRRRCHFDREVFLDGDQLVEVRIAGK